MLNYKNTFKYKQKIQMTKTKMQFFSHKLLLVGFMAVSILGTAASCSSNTIDNKSPKVDKVSSIFSNPKKDDLNLSPTTTSSLTKAEVQSIKSSFNQKNDSGTLDSRVDNKKLEEIKPSSPPPVQIQNKIQKDPLTPSTIEKPIAVEIQPNIEEKIVAPIYTTPQTKEQTQNLISTNSNLTCKDIGHRVYIGNPDYLPKLDKDGDGIGCESFKK